jgi:hypothetical protein
MDYVWLELAAHQNTYFEHKTVSSPWNASITNNLLVIVHTSRPLLLAAEEVCSLSCLPQPDQTHAYTNGRPAVSIIESSRFNR